MCGYLVDFCEIIGVHIHKQLKSVFFELVELGMLRFQLSLGLTHCNVRLQEAVA